MPDDYRYPEYGYFIVIEELEELTNLVVELNAIISQRTARSLEDCVELIEESTGYYQVLLILNSDFGISLFVSNKLIPIEQLKLLLEV